MATITVKVNGRTVSAETNAYAEDATRMSAEDLSKFYKSNGWLSLYSYGCGYMESAEGVTLSAEGVYHVKGGGTWESYEYLKDAKAEFVRRVKAALKAKA